MSSEIEIAVFPIPNMVTFPDSVVPLHVFEPRYRTMIKDCAREKRRVAVAHVKRLVSQGKEGQELEEQLQSNQSTYEPQEVFSAGFCEITDITADGRMMVEIHMDGRYRIQSDKQEVPYRVAFCEEISDEPIKDQALGDRCRGRLDKFLIHHVGNDTSGSLREVFEGEGWQGQTLEEYSFAFFQVIGFDPDIQQEILEMTRPEDRLSFICRVLNLEHS